MTVLFLRATPEEKSAIAAAAGKIGLSAAQYALWAALPERLRAGMLARTAKYHPKIGG